MVFKIFHLIPLNNMKREERRIKTLKEPCVWVCLDVDKHLQDIDIKEH